MMDVAWTSPIFSGIALTKVRHRLNGKGGGISLTAGGQIVQQ